MILAIDAGTTGIRALVIDADGHVPGRAYREFTQYFPRPGWVEHDADEIWSATREVAKEAASMAGVQLDDLQGMGITNQRETVVLWERATGRPVHRAIVWQDRRTIDICRALTEEGAEPEIRARTGLVIDPYFSATKIAWLLQHHPELRARAEAGELAAGTIDSWLIWKMTGGELHITEPTNASRTLLFNINERRWDPYLLDRLGIPAALLPDVRGSSEIYGTTDRSAFGAELPIAGVAGDQQAALFGQGCWSPGLAKNTYGTGAFLLLHTGEHRVASEHGLLTTVACGPRGEFTYALEGAIFVAGAAVQWLRDALGVISSAPESEQLASSLESNDGVYFVPAFTGLGAPHWEAAARGTIVGLTRGTGTAHLARAALEAMAYSTCEVARAMEADSGIVLRELRVDGGAASNSWMMQFQSDLLGVNVHRPAMIETTAWGAAGLAGIALGVWKSPEAFLAAREEPTIFHSTMTDADREEHLRGWTRAVSAARAWATEPQ